MNDIVAIAKGLLIGLDKKILANGFIKAVDISIPSYDMAFGNNRANILNRVNIPNRDREIKLDIVFDISDEQLERIYKKIQNGKLKIMLIDGDE